jgi:hypothetical protein
MAISRSAIAVTVGLALAPFAGFSLLDAGKAEAVEDTYIRAFFAGDDTLGSRNWCHETAGADKSVLSGFVAAWLGLDSTQNAKLGALLDAASSALANARDLCPDRLQAQSGLPLPDRLAAMRRQLGEADILVAAIETPLRDFYQSLDDKQRHMLDEQRPRRTERHGWGRQ